MIRVTFAIDPPFLGGAEVYVARLATGLDRRDFAVSLVMHPSADHALGEWARDLSGQGIDVQTVPMRLPFHPADAIRVHRVFAELAPDIVHVNMPGPYSGQTALLAPIARAAGARVVVTEHLPMVPPLWKRTLVKRGAIRFVDAAVTMTRANAELLVERQGYPKGRVHVVENGVPLAYGSTVSREDARTALGLGAHEAALVFVGNLIPHKGLLDTIRALSRIADRAWRLLVVGDGPERTAAKTLAAGLGIGERVVFLGRQSGPEVERILGASDALVLPSSMEGLPYVILEAMACARPVVSTRVFGIPEAVIDGETGSLVAPGDVDALARALRAIVVDPELRARMGRAGRARFEARFTLERQLARMSALYRACVAGARVKEADR